MRLPSPTILGIDPGARQLGVAVFKGRELIFYAVKTIKEENTAKTLLRLCQNILGLIAEYKVDYIALEKVVFVQQHRSLVKVISEHVKEIIKAENIPLFEYNPKIVRKFICRFQKPTKANTARILAGKYPELIRYFNAPKTWQKRYYAQLLDAVAVGFVCSRQNKTKTFSPFNRAKSA